MSDIKISVIIPTYNEALGLPKILADLKAVMESLGQPHEILVVDDGSTDGTGDLAKSAGARVIRHPYNIGNGAAIKTAVRASKGEILVLMDGDGQHQPREIPKLLAGITEYDMVVGARLGSHKSSLHRLLANKVFNLLATYVTHQRIPDLTSGFRVIKRAVARRFVYLLPNTFSYPTTITMALIKAGYSVNYVPIEIERREGKSKIRIFADGWRFFIIIIKIATLFSPFKVFLPISLISLFMGLTYGAYMIIFFSHFSPMVLLLFLTSMIVFLMGLIAEEINMLRFERTEE